MSISATFPSLDPRACVERLGRHEPIKESEQFVYVFFCITKFKHKLSHPIFCSLSNVCQSNCMVESACSLKNFLEAWIAFLLTLLRVSDQSPLTSSLCSQHPDIFFGQCGSWSSYLRGSDTDLIPSTHEDQINVSRSLQRIPSGYIASTIPHI
jgi:hypothetical protein